jgi:hypothetical protein
LRDHHVLENFPWTGEIDHRRAVGDRERNGDLSFAGGVSLLLAKANELSGVVATTAPKQALWLIKSLLFIVLSSEAQFSRNRGRWDSIWYELSFTRDELNPRISAD